VRQSRLRRSAAQLRRRRDGLAVLPPVWQDCRPAARRNGGETAVAGGDIVAAA